MRSGREGSWALVALGQGKGNRGTDGSDDDATSLNHVGRVGYYAELLRPDVDAEMKWEISMS